MPSTFNEQQWAEVGHLNKTIQAYEKHARQNKDDNYPRMTFDVLKAFRTCPRHIFCHPKHAHEAYQDRARPISDDQVISQPSQVAMMTALLGVKPGDKVLEIGTGSGYQAAVLATMGVGINFSPLKARMLHY